MIKSVPLKWYKKRILTSGSALPILSNKYSENLGQMTDAVGTQFNGCDVKIAL